MKLWLDRWVNKIRYTIRRMTDEDRAVALLGASFFVGVWYAFPMVNTITDVWAFGGGVLRALEAHTLLPGPDVAYGTVSFYQNYFGMVVALLVALPFYGFDIDALKTALVLNPAYSLMVSRIMSALTAVVLLVFVYRFLKAHVDSLWWRLALLALVFGNVLTALLTRSGKMWILSIGLGVISFIYLYRALTEEKEAGKPGKLSAVSIGSAFLAAANFSFAGLFLINIPILYFAFPKTRESFLRLVSITAGGAGLFLLFFAPNAENTFKQLSEFIIPFLDGGARMVSDGPARLTFPEAFAVNGRHAVEAFPLLILAAVLVVSRGLRDPLLRNLALVYLMLYIVAVAVVFRTDHGLALNVRHIFPLCFFMLFFITSYRPPTRRVAIALFAVGVGIYVYTLFLLSVPTTYNKAADFIVERYGDSSIRIHEDIFELTLPMNKASYSLFGDSWCGSTCTYMRGLEGDIAFKPIVTTGESDRMRTMNLEEPRVVLVERAIPGCTPLMQFTNDVSDDRVFDIDINLGRMLMPEFYQLSRLGKNIYIYDRTTCSAPLTYRTGGVQ